MKLKFAFLPLAVLVACQSPSAPEQNSPPPEPPKLYAAGGQMGVPELAVVWTNGERTNVGSGEALAVAKKGTDLYVAGYSNDSAGYWLKGVWHDLAPPGSVSSRILGMGFTSDDWMAGVVEDDEALEHATLWKNRVAQELPSVENHSSYASSLLVVGQDVYVGGYVQNTASVDKPGYWKNRVWTPLPTAGDGKGGAVYAMASAGGALYAAGQRQDESTGVWAAGYWKNGVWNSLPGQSSSRSSVVYGLSVQPNGDVYAAGWAYGDTGQSRPGYWKNGIWNGLPALDTERVSGGTSVMVVGTDVYVGGYTSNGSFQWRGGYWKNGVWTPLGEDGQFHIVNALLWG